MHVLSFVTQKGGSGKSTLLLSCAVAAQEAGQRVMIVEMDPQGTAARWIRGRERAAPDLEVVQGPQLEAELSRFKRDRYSLVLIDTPGIDSPATRPAMTQADFCIIPVRPTGPDVQGCLATARALTQLHKPFVFVVNQAPAPLFALRVRETMKALSQAGDVLDVTMVARNDHQDAVTSGLGVTELDPKGKAAKEIRQLWKALSRRMKIEAGHDQAA